MSRETYYTVLGIAESASQSDIKSAYRSLLKKIHPDTVSTLSEETRRHAEDATRDINEAYSVLSDAGQRAEYDFFLAEQRKAAVAVSASQSTQSATLSSSTSNSVTHEGDVALQERRRRRRRRRRSHDRRHSSRHGYVKSLFRPVSVADWLVLFGYVFLAVAVLVILFFLVSSVPSLQEESKRVGRLKRAQIAVVWINGAGDRDRTGDIQLGKLAFYR
jgi:cobalamin biosynthesis Mg chelatase CobN